MRRLLPLLIALALYCSVSAQQPAPAQSDATFRSSTRLIVQDVSVTDKDGRPVEGLMPRDFVVTEDGEAQQIAFVEFQRLQGAADRAPVAPPSPAAAIVASTTQTQISSSPPGDVRYRDRRLLVLYFD